MALAEPHCYTRGCKHFRGVDRPDPREELGERPVCLAYPDILYGGIPDRIAYDPPETANLHVDVQEDQTGTFVFEEEDDD